MLIAWSAVARPGADDKSWLDQPLTNWNQGRAVPAAAPAASEPRDQVRSRCGMPPGGTGAQRTLEELGWIAYEHLDRELTQGDIEIVAGMTGADEMCRPAHFQIFVFVGGRFAGTLSPQAMTSGQDASAGAVRIVPDDSITSEFARFREGDAPCCPTSRMTVRYRIDRSGQQALVVPVDVRTTRGQ